MGIIEGAERLFEHVEPAKETYIALMKAESLVAYMADWCGPCKQFMQHLGKKPEQLNRLRGAGVATIYRDVDVLMPGVDTGHVRGIPYFELLANGKSAARIVGYDPIGLENAITEYLAGLTRSRR